jgi:hypothetical protein
MMHEYTICTVADEEIYRKQCKAIEKRFNIKPENVLEDVDGSLISVYHYDDKEILVINDEDIGIVQVKSEIELKQFFK